MATELAEKECLACKGGLPRLTEAEHVEYLKQLGEGWSVVDGHHLRKGFSFADFAEALSFANKVGVMAEANQHHPELRVSWGKVDVLIWTHNVDGLTESDFVLAAKTDLID